MFTTSVGNSPWVFPSPNSGANLPGQCAAYAPPSAETGRAAQGAVPRLAPHLRHPGLTKRGRCENRIWNAGSLLGRLHPGHLCPHHQRCPASGGTDHGKRAGGDDSMPRMRAVRQIDIARGAFSAQRINGADIGNILNAVGNVVCPVCIIIGEVH